MVDKMVKVVMQMEPEPEPAVCADDVESEAPGGIELLPHELLLLVLAHLGTRQLLQVRAVCRRWRDAALDPALWRPRGLQWRDGPEAAGGPLYAAVLRLAPCLRSLRVECQGTGNDLLAAMACSTRCAVEDLSVFFDSENAVFAAMTVRNQEGLGRLRTVFLCFLRRVPGGPVVGAWRDLERDAAGAGLLLDVACRAKGLAKLDFATITSKEMSVNSLPTPQPVPASLRELVDCAWVPGPQLCFLLRCHAPTLEKVSLRHDLRNVEAVGETLSRVGNLVELICGLMEDMTALLQCTKLRTLALVVGESSHSATALREAKDFLRRAASLTDVTFGYWLTPEGACADLVGALASPHHAAVERVAFDLDGVGEVELLMTERFVRAFALALPWLSALREVRVDGVPPLASFLEAVSPASAPSLRLLLVKLEHDVRIDATPCAHSFLHRAEVRGVLERNPLLHVQVASSYADCFFRDEYQCELCSQANCHSLLHDLFNDARDEWRGAAEKIVTLYSHPEVCDECEVPHLGSASGQLSFALSLDAL